jgi:DNA-binding MarR family transcriptional regulator
LRLIYLVLRRITGWPSSSEPRATKDLEILVLRHETALLRRQPAATFGPQPPDLGRRPRRHEAVLSWLARKGPLTTAELARWEQIRPQSMGSTVTELTSNGLVSKRADPSDGRRELVSLTDEGARTLAGVAEQRDRDLAALLDIHLTDEERALVGQSLALLERVAGEAQ